MSDLDNLSVGDKVCLVNRAGWSGRISLQTGAVERVTKTQITAINGRKFVKRTGYEVGSRPNSYNKPTLRPLTDELVRESIEAIRFTKAEKKCREFAAILEAARNEDAVRLANMLPEGVS